MRAKAVDGSFARIVVATQRVRAWKIAVALARRGGSGKERGQGAAQTQAQCVHCYSYEDA